MLNFIKNIFLRGNTDNQKKQNLSNDISYEDELLYKFGTNENSIVNHINLLIITDTHNCLYYDKESIEKNQKCPV